MIEIEATNCPLQNYIGMIFTDFESNFKTCKNHADEEAIHDTRVALRRLISLMSFLFLVNNDASSLKLFRKKAKKYQKLFGPTRDIHVTLNHLQRLDANQYALSDFMDYLGEIKMSEEKKLHDTLKAYKASTIIDIKEDLLRLAMSFSNEEHMKDKVLSVIDDAYLNLIDKLYQIDANQLNTLHDIRIALKDFRYKIDILSLISNEHQGTVKLTKAIQDQLGEIQDLRVLLNYYMVFVEAAGLSNENSPLKTYLIDTISRQSHDFYNQRFEIHRLWEVTT